MGGYNFSYLICVKFEKPVDEEFLKQLSTEFFEELYEDLRKWISLDRSVETENYIKETIQNY